MPRYKAPAGVIGINIGGQQFNVDATGAITVPDEGDYRIPPDYERIEDAMPSSVAQMDDEEPQH